MVKQNKICQAKSIFMEDDGCKNPQPIMWASDNLFTGKIPDLICNWTELTDLLVLKEQGVPKGEVHPTYYIGAIM
ncbi:hypothetical protein EJ110_NYTH29230 [Nymphaea thermarum]|nr:hypothetical protein EJ110_NYTH29230 [Nymphaea thermarum]